MVEVAVIDPDVAEGEASRSILAALPDTQRTALILRVQLGFPYNKVSRVLG